MNVDNLELTTKLDTSTPKTKRIAIEYLHGKQREIADLILHLQDELDKETGPRYEVGERVKFTYDKTLNKLGRVLDVRFAHGWEYRLEYKGLNAKRALSHAWFREDEIWLSLGIPREPTKARKSRETAEQRRTRQLRILEAFTA